MVQLRQQISNLAKANLIDKIRFIDCGELAPVSAFPGRQPLDLMPEGRSIIFATVFWTIILFL